MLFIAEICGVLVWLILFVAFCYGIYNELTDPWGDTAGVCVYSVFLIVLLGLTALAFHVTNLENSNPCIAWGETQTTYVMMGKVLTPITTTPCIRRQHEVEK